MLVFAVPPELCCVTFSDSGYVFLPVPFGGNLKNYSRIPTKNSPQIMYTILNSVRYLLGQPLRNHKTLRSAVLVNNNGDNGKSGNGAIGVTFFYLHGTMCATAGQEESLVPKIHFLFALSFFILGLDLGNIQNHQDFLQFLWLLGVVTRFCD